VGLRSGYEAFNMAVEALYKSEIMTLADKDKRPFDFDDTLFEAAARLVYESRGFDLSQLEDPAARAVIEETLRVLSTAIDSGLPHEVPATLRHALENNAFIFSGFKTFHAMREVGISMITEKGDIKPFGDFLADVRKINEKYNHNYLYAEYNHALGAAQMAAKWHDFEQDGDRYNLQYRTAGDNKVREEHALLHGTTLPPSDPFWDRFYPPNGWNCRCTVVQVRKNKYPLSDPELANKRGENCTDGIKRQIFRYNAGKTLELFPPKHPYTKVPKEAKTVIQKIAAEEMRQKRIQEMVAELPDSLTQEEKQAIATHNINIEEAFGITKEAAMDYEQANKGKENPNYTKGGGYYVNCQTCTVTHWLRRLGFNVEAKPNIKNSAYKELEKQGLTWQQRFTNLDGSDVDYDMTYKWQRRKGYNVMNAKRLNEYLSEKLNQDGVYEIYCAWKNGNAHVFCAEVTNGKVRFFDPQSGSNDVKSYLPRMKSSRVGVLRIDNKLVNPKLKNLFINK
jgi:SPP1 gp7 family putative phage head morphogenesis protein